MSHPRKKGGERKDKKNQRMREDVAQRHAEAGEPGPSTDQPDIVTYKPGHQSDHNRQPQPNQPQKR